MNDRSVRTELPSPRLAVVLDGPRWFVRHGGSFYRVDAETGLRLSEWLPLDAFAGGLVDEGPADVDFCADRVEIRLPDGGGGRAVVVNSSPVELLTSVSLDPDPTPDGWVPTSFAVVVEDVETLSLHLFLPAAADSSPKRCVVTVDEHTVAEGNVARGRESTIDICVPERSGAVELRIEFDQAERRIDADDERELGAVLVGITRSMRMTDP